MSPIALIVHLANFVAPAIFLALVLPLMARFMPGASPRMPWWRQAALQFGAGVAVLVGGLVFFGRDGAMATYSAMVLVCATLQWGMAARSGR
ncbi:hypothetical protein QTH91_04260 [Variovorax dokdonensis]|uniref:Uncharacterized protein n=1 Tax=Variovorax dokdonensis TaxID=344883 RepID=A0ABT7N6X6_9BURK|nr:hypothetical protein [Variovorax dokdonensis]MDM0043687.1 hypothetical protein [Variovorax dokdonensis]